MRSRILLSTLFLMTLFPSLAFARETPAEHAANIYAAQELASNPVGGNLPDDSLVPNDLAKARHLHSIDINLVAIDTVWGVLQLALLLWLGGIAWIRDKAVLCSANRSLQGLVFTGLFVLAVFLLNLPLRVYGHHLSLQYGLSVQRWPSWFGDKAKSLALEWIVGTLLILLLFWVIRKFPRHWWLPFWAASIPITFFAIFVGPYIGFLFNQYEPMAKNHAALATRIKQVVDRGHMNIPVERMFVMKASAKVTTMNADVEGFGSSKRVVVWDTTIDRLTPEEVVAVFGHESGHYVLNHIRNGIFQSFLIVFLTLWLGFLFVSWALARFGARWRIPDQSDWGAAAVLMLAFSLYGIVLGPLTNTLSRRIEHDADVYGMEAIHGLVPDPQAAMRGTMQKLGQASFDVPNTARWEEVLLSSHPAIGRRAAFAHAYNPWAPGMAPKYFKK